MNLRPGNPAAVSVFLSSISIAVLSFLIAYIATQSFSPGAISLFTTLVFASPFLLLPAAVLAIIASKQPVNKFTHLSRLLLGLDAALLLALLALLYT